MDEDSRNVTSRTPTPLDTARTLFVREPTAGVDALHVLAEEGVAEAMTLLASAYQQGRGAPQDPAAAKAWYRKAADQGAPEALHPLGCLFFAEKDYPQARIIFAEGAARGDSRCAEDYTKLVAYEKGEQEVRVVRPLVARQRAEPDVVFRELCRLAKNGSAYGMLYLAQAHKLGRGTAVDRSQAEMWYRRALAEGLPGVQRYGAYQLGWLLAEDRRYEEAREIFQVGANQGFGPCTHRLADMARRGQGCAQDLRSARALYEQAVREGQVFAIWDLGILMIRGPFGWRARAQGMRLLLQTWSKACRVAIDAGYKDERLWR
ncbi:MAG TPA: tetratricopeptide repeat protein [Acidiferrobacter sp.]|nr:tetratricopeptide repeat protein [Acidiferrobacter sp.]